MSKAAVVVMFVCLAFAIYFGINSVIQYSEWKEADRQLDLSKQELDQSLQQLGLPSSPSRFGEES